MLPGIEPGVGELLTIGSKNRKIGKFSGFAMWIFMCQQTN